MRHRRIVVLCLAVLAAACGGTDPGSRPSPTSAQTPTAVDEQMQLTEQQADALAEAGYQTEGLLQGLPASCVLAEAADGPVQQAVDRLAVDLAAAGSRGPIVAVEAADGLTVLASTLVAADGSVGDAAVWTVSRDEAAITAGNALAGELTDVELQPIDTRGTDAVASAMAEAMDCSWVAADVTHTDPPAPAATMRPDLLVLDPTKATPGELVAMRFPEETARGVAFDLDRRVGDGWETVAWMTSDGNGDEPITVAAGTQGHGVPDVGVGGPGPDHVRLPEHAMPGEHRICTANAGDDFCALLELSAD